MAPAALLTYLLLSAALLSSSTSPAVAALSPSEAEFLADLEGLQRAAEKDFRFALAAQFIAEFKDYSDISLRLFYNTTFLVPTNAAIANLGVSASAITNITALGQFASTALLNVIARRYTFAQIKALKTKAPAATLLPNQRLRRFSVRLTRREKMMRAHTGVALGLPGTGNAAWGKIVKGDLYSGKYLKAHGVAGWVQAPNVNVTDILVGIGLIK